VRPDVIVMDMSLPRLDGREAARLLRADARTRSIPLVMISGYDADALPSNDGLWDQYLGKPCPPEQLVSVIGRLVA
jgi:CheY-like chemotaxis protein